MGAKEKVTNGWAIRYPRGGICLRHISHARRSAINSFCDNGPESKPDDWQDWRKKGYRAVKIEIREAT